MPRGIVDVSLFNIAFSSRFFCERPQKVATPAFHLTPFLALKSLLLGRSPTSDSKARYGVQFPLDRNIFRDAEANALPVFANIACIRRTLMSKEQENKAIVGRWFTSFWGPTCDLSIVDALAAPDMLLQYSLHEPAADTRTSRRS